MKAFFQATGLAVAVSLSAMAVADTATGTGINPERVFAFNGAMPTGVTVTETDRIFINFPRWGDDVPYTVAEIKQQQKGDQKGDRSIFTRCQPARISQKRAPPQQACWMAQASPVFAGKPAPTEVRASL